MTTERPIVVVLFSYLVCVCAVGFDEFTFRHASQRVFRLVVLQLSTACYYIPQTRRPECSKNKHYSTVPIVRLSLFRCVGMLSTQVFVLGSTSVFTCFEYVNEVKFPSIKCMKINSALLQLLHAGRQTHMTRAMGLFWIFCSWTHLNTMYQWNLRFDCHCMLKCDRNIQPLFRMW